MDATPTIACFGYHEVTDLPATSGFQRQGAIPYKLGRQAFRAHLDRIAAGANAPTLVSAIDWTQSGRYLLLTFDDGGKSAAWVGDELSRRGWRGHFFVITTRIGARTFLDASGIRALRSAGHIVGTHSHTHPDIFRDHTPERMLVEWRVSCDRLANLLGEPCLVGSLPGGDGSRAAWRSAAEAGLTHLFTSEPWLRPRRIDGCWVLGRFAPKVSTSAARVERLARFHTWGRARAWREFSVLARRALGPLYRRYVSGLSVEAAEAQPEDAR